MAAGATTALSWEEAQGIVKEVEALFGRVDITGIVAGFTPDAVARFGDFPEMRGRQIAQWDAVFTSGKRAARPASPSFSSRPVSLTAATLRTGIDMIAQRGQG